MALPNVCRTSAGLAYFDAAVSAYQAKNYFISTGLNVAGQVFDGISTPSSVTGISSSANHIIDQTINVEPNDIYPVSLTEQTSANMSAVIASGAQVFGSATALALVDPYLQVAPGTPNASSHKIQQSAGIGNFLSNLASGGSGIGGGSDSGGAPSPEVNAFFSLALAGGTVAFLRRKRTAALA